MNDPLRPAFGAGFQEASIKPRTARESQYIGLLAIRYRNARRHYRQTVRELVRSEAVASIGDLSTSSRILEATLHGAMIEAWNAYQGAKRIEFGIDT